MAISHNSSTNFISSLFPASTTLHPAPLKGLMLVLMRSSVQSVKDFIKLDNVNVLDVSKAPILIKHHLLVCRILPNVRQDLCLILKQITVNKFNVKKVLLSIKGKIGVFQHANQHNFTTQPLRHVRLFLKHAYLDKLSI